MLGDVKKLITDIQNLADHANETLLMNPTTKNQTIFTTQDTITDPQQLYQLDEHQDEEETDQPKKLDNNGDNKDARHWKNFQPNHIQQLSEKNNPPLIRRPYQSGPGAYNSKHPNSLGLIDSHCRWLAYHINNVCDKNTSFKQLQQELDSYTHQNNFLKHHHKTKQYPADIHLGRHRYLAQTSWYNLFQNETTLESSLTQEIRTCLQRAHIMNQDQENIEKAHRKALAIQKREHPTLVSQERFLEMYPRFSMVVIENPVKRKIHTSPKYHGPHIIITRQTAGRNLYTLNPDTGKISKRSYRQTKPYISQELYNIPPELSRYIQQAYPLALNHKPQDPTLGNSLRQQQTQLDIQDSENKFVRNLKNITQAIGLLPDLPNVNITTRVIQTEKKNWTEHTPVPVPIVTFNPSIQTRVIEPREQNTNQTENATYTRSRGGREIVTPIRYRE